MVKNRNWVFTYNNKDDEENVRESFNSLKELDIIKSKIKYICFALERGEVEKNLHIQGYCEFENAIGRKTMMKRLNGLKLFMGLRQGSRYQARGYIMDPDFVSADGKPKTGETYEKVELGLWTQQGRDNGLTEAYNLVKEGKSDYEIQELMPKIYGRYYKAIEKMRFNWLKNTLPGWKDIPIHVIYGDTRTGKTSGIFSKYGYDDCFKLKIENTNNIWFDGYSGEKVLIIDDFYGQVRFSLLLQLLDGYKQTLQIKGGFTWAQWDKIYITSNVHPEKWYNNYTNIPDDARDALYERITSVTRKVRDKSCKRRGLPKTVTEIFSCENNKNGTEVSTVIMDVEPKAEIKDEPIVELKIKKSKRRVKAIPAAKLKKLRKMVAIKRENNLIVDKDIDGYTKRQL